MSYQTKKRIIDITVYIVLALVIAGIISIAVVTLSSSLNKPQKPMETPVTQGATDVPPTPATKLPGVSTNAPTSIPDNPNPTLKPAPGVTPAPSDTKLPADGPVNESYTLPAAGYVMKEYSVELPVFSLTMEDYRTHSGIDISIAEGEAVCSIGKGKVKEVYTDPMMGKTVVIDHGQGIISTYSNLGDELAEGIAENVTVGAGQIIGTVGGTSLMEVAESDHLHFELTVAGDCVDPLDYLDFSDYTTDMDQ